MLQPTTVLLEEKGPSYRRSGGEEEEGPPLKVDVGTFENICTVFLPSFFFVSLSDIMTQPTRV